jgi:hypothetical protein
MEYKGLTIEKWEQKSIPYHLTIKDIMDMKENKKYNLFHIDRNFYDFVDMDTKGINLPTFIFRKNYKSIFTKSKDISGTTEWIFSDNDRRTDDTVWHIDLGHIWYPLHNGYVPLEDSMGLFNIGEHAGKHWTELPKTTRIGWRGPCMLMSDINKVGNIYN